ncbi:MAG: amidase [Burkholderiaceae bacterium]|nr:amidase [Burkholderiaceae bacterium]
MPALTDYENHDALALAALVRQGETTPAELLDAAIARADALDPKLNAITTRFDALAREAIARDLPDGPLRGVPFVLKDISVQMAGTRTSSGCALFADHLADHDSTLVARYRRAGLVIFGKTNTPEMGLAASTESGLLGVCRNPWSLEHSSGGSSGGAAAAVAAGIVPVAHATDGGGSIRIPAANCGLVGLKPTRGRVPHGPDLGEGWGGMSIGHVVSRSVRDSAAFLDVVSGRDVGDPYDAPHHDGSWLEAAAGAPARLRIALCTRPFNGAPLDDACRDAAEATARLCEHLGHQVEPVDGLVDFEAARAASRVITSSNVRMALEARAAALGRALVESDLEHVTWRLVEAAKRFSAMDYAQAVQTIHRTGREVGRFFTRFDALLTPTQAAPAPRLGTMRLSNPDTRAFTDALDRAIGFTALFNISGSPAISLPLAWTDDGIPVGVQFVADMGGEARLLQLATQMEQAQPWAGRRPAVF